MLSIVTYPDPVLENEAEDVHFPLNAQTKQLIADMWEVVKGKGVGLAAPQVGVSKKICIIHLSEDPDLRKKFKKKADFVMINPKITFGSELESLMVEGCLSFPDEYYQIWRPANIMVEYYTEEGKKKTLRAKGWLSRIIQHEVDHLHGKIFIKMGGTKITDADLIAGAVD